MIRLRSGTLLLGTLLLGLPLAPQALADPPLLAEIDDLERGDVIVRGFALDRAQDVQVTATSLVPEHPSWHSDDNSGRTAAWILAAASREVVWDMEAARPAKTSRGVREYDASVRLEPGAYEVYYAVRPLPEYALQSSSSWWESALASVFRVFADWGTEERWSTDDLRLAVRGQGRQLSAAEVERGRAQGADALVALVGLGNSVHESRGFTVREPLELSVYAVGEVTRDGGYDYGWILDTESHRRVWELDYGNSEPAGGARKNRVFRGTVQLPPGRYAAVFMSDSSHAPGSWNALPPHDPAAWGLTLRAPAAARQNVALFDYKPFDDEKALAELVQVRDEDFKTEALTVEAPIDVRVYAVGEGSRDEMSDYGWIVDARTRRTVWSMDYERTEHAGGSQKNRVADERLHLEPGSYLVTFVTDGSHAYGDWNSDPPVTPERWGIILFAASEGAEKHVRRELEKADESWLLARISPVRDDRNEERRFTLERETEVAVYALGEGDDGEMYDYGWIEEAKSGRVVWEMTYRLTDPAGGAAKNRVYQGNLRLNPGEYRLRYRSDGSHSFGDWNADPPRDPTGWGIQVALPGATTDSGVRTSSNG